MPTHPVPVRAGNSLVDGWSRGVPWRELDLAGAWILSRLHPDDTVHRIYPRRPGARPELRDGVWWWV